MAQRIVTQLVDDLDGTELNEDNGETVSFALDGTAFKIDLSLKNADAFRGIFQDYIAAGRKVGAGRRTASKKTSASSGPTAAEVRAWAQNNGYDVPSRGRIPAEVRDAFDAS